MSKSKIPVRFTGQHFTIDKKLISDAIRYAALRKDTIVLDIGAGKGFLTRALSGYCKKVIAIEKDGPLCRYLRNLYQHDPNIALFSGDFRNFVFPRHAFSVVSNIPYGITAFILKKLMYDQTAHFTGGVLIIQHEVAKKLVLQTNLFNPMHILYQTFYTIEVVYKVPPESFLPPPTVGSALIRIRKKNTVVHTDAKKAYLDFISFMLRKPHRLSLTALKQVFRKKQVRRLSDRYGIRLTLPVAALSPLQWAGCFALMVEEIPERYHPRRLLHRR